MRFFEKIDERDIPLARTAKKREKTDVTVISNERGTSLQTLQTLKE